MLENNQESEFREIVSKINNIKEYSELWFAVTIDQVKREIIKYEGDKREYLEKHLKNLENLNHIDRRIASIIEDGLMIIQSDYAEIIEAVDVDYKHELIDWIYQLLGIASNIIVQITKELDGQMYLMYEDYIKIFHDLQGLLLKDILIIEELEVEDEVVK